MRGLVFVCVCICIAGNDEDLQTHFQGKEERGWGLNSEERDSCGMTQRSTVESEGENSESEEDFEDLVRLYGEAIFVCAPA